MPICWETHITAFNSSGGIDTSRGVAGDICSGNRKSGGTHISATPSTVAIACSLVFRIANLLLAIATEAALHCKYGRGSCQVCGRGWANSTKQNIKKMHKQASKRFQVKSNRDVQHTGLQSTQTRGNYSSNNTGKQGAQTRGTRHIFPSIPTSVAA